MRRMHNRLYAADKPERVPDSMIGSPLSLSTENGKLQRVSEYTSPDIAEMHIWILR
jgi:hypothetical protein